MNEIRNLNGKFYIDTCRRLCFQSNFTVTNFHCLFKILNRLNKIVSSAYA